MSVVLSDKCHQRRMMAASRFKGWGQEDAADVVSSLRKAGWSDFVRMSTSRKFVCELQEMETENG
jgi:hypothetical protein